MILWVGQDYVFSPIFFKQDALKKYHVYSAYLVFTINKYIEAKNC